MAKTLRQEIDAILSDFLIVPSELHYKENPGLKHWTEIRLDRIEQAFLAAVERSKPLENNGDDSFSAGVDEFSQALLEEITGTTEPYDEELDQLRYDLADPKRRTTEPACECYCHYPKDMIRPANFKTCSHCNPAVDSAKKDD